MNIKSISIKNFRVFKDKTTFQLRPFTILTGPNNSGKSSFIKFLLLLKEGEQKLDFDKGAHNLKDFDSVINHKKNNDNTEMTFELTFQKSPGFYSNYYYSDEVLRHIEVFSQNNLVLKYELDKDYGKDSIDHETVIPISYINFYFNINIWIENLEKILIAALEKNKNSRVDFNKDEFTRKVIEYKNNSHYGLLFKLFDEQMNDITLFYKDQLLQLQSEFFNRNFTSVYGSNNKLYKSMEEVLENEFRNFPYFIKDNFKKLYNTDTKVALNFLGELSLKLTEFEVPIDIYNYFIRLIKIESFNNNLVFLSANRGTHNRVFLNDSDAEINKLLVEFYDTQNKNINFINKCLEILEIPGEIKICRYEKTISTVNLIQNGLIKSFADLGFGYSQILPIILTIHKILTTNESLYKTLNDKTLILEEPEANLHPNMQSKLAELITYIQKTYKLNFIIETHSEYFIRKLQYLTAKNVLNKKDTVIYYFNDDKYVTAKEPKVKEIFINKFGGLSDAFGPGFFDEATRLQFDLMKLNKEQMN